MTARTTTIAAIAATGALAFGAGFAIDDSGGTTAAAAGPAPTTHDGQGQGQGRGKGHGQGRGKGHGQGQGKGHGQGQGKGHGQGQKQGHGPGAMGAGHGDGQGKRGGGSGQGPGTTSTAKQTLTATQRAELRYMREEEKLAEDVYRVLAQRYPDAAFARIAVSEQRHASAMQRQLDRAGIADPTTGNLAGEFENAELQRLYDTLVARGATSLTAALKVGALIEETDIAGLRRSTSNTRDARTKRVYGNLERASGQHLRIFVGELKDVGATYRPTVLSQADYDEILASSMR